MISKQKIKLPSFFLIKVCFFNFSRRISLKLATIEHDFLNFAQSSDKKSEYPSFLEQPSNFIEKNKQISSVYRKVQKNGSHKQELIENFELKVKESKISRQIREKLQEVRTFSL